MARVTFRLNVTASSFPLLSRNYGASVASRGRLDTDYVITNQYSGSQADAFIGIPTFLYMHNCMPYTHGIQAVGFEKKHAGLAGATDFDTAFILRSGTEKIALFSPGRGKNYVNLGNNWQSVAAPYKMGGSVTVAYLKQRTFICYEGNGIFELSTSTGQMRQVTLKGLNPSALLGITAANNYLIGYDSDSLFWSDPTDELNFLPTLASTAGSESILSAKGSIVCVHPVENGFIVYTTTNAIAGVYSGDIRFPWVYREIDGSSGVQSSTHVAWTSNYSGHYAWTNAGLQLLGLQQAENVFPEVSDFLAGNEIEDYVGDLGNFPNNSARDPANSTYGQFVNANLGVNQLVTNKLDSQIPQFKIKVAMVESRYLVLSYGALELTHCLVYDISLKRWGKLKASHVAAFNYINPKNDLAYAKHSLALLTRSGEVKCVDFDYDCDKQDSVLFFGNVQFARGNSGSLLAVEASSIDTNKCELSILPSLNGKSWLPQINPIIVDDDGRQVRYQEDIPGKAFVLKFAGRFQLNSLTITGLINRGVT